MKRVQDKSAWGGQCIQDIPYRADFLEILWRDFLPGQFP
jgi:hypothetical protein